MHYNLESSQSDRINFDEMVRRGLEAVLDAVEKEAAIYYASQDPEAFIGIQWDADSVAYTAESLEYAGDMGLIYIEDLQEAEARHRSVCKEVLTAYLDNLVE